MKKPTNSFIIGAVALVFGILGYQTALLVHYTATARIVAARDHPDTVYIYESAPAGAPEGAAPQAAAKYGSGTYGSPIRAERHNSAHAPYAGRVRESRPPRQVETFRFNPNTAPVEDLIRLGFSQKQAASIDSYRRKGGRFRRREDFARSYVVSDSIYSRLESFIDIPLIDLNAADSAAFDSLPGIGGYFASRIVQYRARLGGYSYPEQLMDIYRFDSLRFAAVRELVTVSPPAPYRLWSLPADSLALHPYIGRAARGVVFFREHNPRSEWSVAALGRSGVLDATAAGRLSRCAIESP